MSAELRSAGPPRLHDDVLDVRLRFSKIGAFISASLILLGVGLDLATYPERLGEFFALRVVTALISLGIMGLLHRGPGHRQVQWLTLAWLVLPQIMISWMIFETEGVSSIYFVGLQLALFGVGLERMVIRPILGQPAFSIVMLTIGVGFVLRGLITMIPVIGTETHTLPVPYKDEIWTLGTSGEDSLAAAAVDRFCLSLGSVAGDRSAGGGGLAQQGDDCAGVGRTAVAPSACS